MAGEGSRAVRAGKERAAPLGPRGAALRSHTARVVAAGRLLFSTLFLLAIWLDDDLPASAPAETYLLLFGYLAFSLGYAAISWRRWWIDARFGGAAHFVDLGVFTALTFSTEGYTSPYFLFFVFLVFSSSIRSGWRGALATAAAVIVLYMIAGFLAASARPDQFEWQRFVIRAGHMFILSALLIWFGAATRPGLAVESDETLDPPIGEFPLSTLAQQSARALGARRQFLFWADGEDDTVNVIETGVDPVRTFDLRDPPLGAGFSERSFLYHRASDEGLHGEDGRLRPFRASHAISAEALATLDLGEGLFIPIASSDGHGGLLLDGIEDLSADHLKLGDEIGERAAAALQRSALSAADSHRAEMRTRLSLSRDLHDNVVQFLAGMAFRLEALVRKPGLPEPFGSDLRGLKALLLDEEAELRRLIEELRSNSRVGGDDVVAEVRRLCAKLERQWPVECMVEANLGDAALSHATLYGLRHLIREAVANAVRHGGATRVTFRFEDEGAMMRVKINDNGTALAASEDPGLSGRDKPRSLSERIAEMGGDFDYDAGPQGTRLNIRLPTERRST